MNKLNKGFIPVMLTPFKSNGDIDFIALEELTNFYLEAGAQGLFANCLSSEMFALTPEERLAITKFIVKTVNGSVPVVATGTFEGTVKSQADFIRSMYDTGIEAAIVITNMMAAQDESDQIFSDNMYELLSLTEDIPLGFYECPFPYKRIISAELLGKFIATERIIYHKDTCLDIHQVSAKIAEGEGYKFGLYDAYMAHAVESLKAGAAGLSCIQGNYFPELIVWLCDNYDNADMQPQLALLQQFLIDKMEIMHKVYPIVAKYYLHKRGLKITTTIRGNQDAFDASVQKSIDDFYEDCVRIQDELNIHLVI